MTSAMKARVVLDDRVDRRLVETLLTANTRLDVADYVELSDQQVERNGDAGDVLIVACADYSTAIGEYVAGASRSHPARPVLLVCSAGVNGHVGDAIGAGADDILMLPPTYDMQVAHEMSQQVVFSVEKALARRPGTPTRTGQKLGRMICVLGLKGGSGKTLTVGEPRGRRSPTPGSSVAIVDLDLQFGDVGLTLGTEPRANAL